MQTGAAIQKETKIRYLAAHPRIVTLASVSLSLAILALALSGMELDQLWQTLREADWRWVAVSALFHLGSMMARSLRWRGLLGGKISVWRAYHAINITNLLNQLPLRAGEVARSLLARQDGVRLLTAATLVALERLLDLLCILAVLLWALGRLPGGDVNLQRTATLVGIGVLFFFALAWWLTRRLADGRQTPVSPSRLPFGRYRLTRALLPVLARILTPIFKGLQSLQDTRLMLITSGWTVVAWLLSLATFAALIPALHMQDADIVLVCALTLTLASLGVAAPLLIASIGVYEGAVLFGGKLAGLNEVDALALAVLAHGSTLALYALMGSIGAAALGISLREIISTSASDEGGKVQPQ